MLRRLTSPIALDLDVVAGRNQILEVTMTVSSDVIQAISAPERLEAGSER